MCSYTRQLNINQWHTCIVLGIYTIFFVIMIWENSVWEWGNFLNFSECSTCSTNRVHLTIKIHITDHHSLHLYLKYQYHLTTFCSTNIKVCGQKNCNNFCPILALTQSFWGQILWYIYCILWYGRTSLTTNSQKVQSNTQQVYCPHWLGAIA